MKKHLLAKQALSLSILILVFGFLFVIPAIAQTGAVTSANNAATASAGKKLYNPLGTADVSSLIGRVINGVMGIVGSLALLMFVYGGLLWMVSGGSQDKVKKGKDIILWSSVGMAVIFGAYALTKFIISALTNN